MIRKSAVALSSAICKREWIKAENFEWCVYALEKWLGLFLFAATVILWMIISGLYNESLTFLVPFYLLRRRVGGFHAKKASVCFTISLVLVIFVSSFLGSLVMQLPTWLFIALNAANVVLGIILRPVYPPQVSFTEEERAANCRRKDFLLLSLFIIQIFSLILHNIQFPAYSFCGIGMCNVTVLIQMKWGEQNEKNREMCG